MTSVMEYSKGSNWLLEAVDGKPVSRTQRDGGCQVRHVSSNGWLEFAYCKHGGHRLNKGVLRAQTLTDRRTAKSPAL